MCVCVRSILRNLTFTNFCVSVCVYVCLCVFTQGNERVWDQIYSISDVSGVNEWFVYDFRGHNASGQAHMVWDGQ